MSEFGPVFITQNLIISSLLTKGKTGQSRSTNDFTDLKMHLSVFRVSIDDSGNLVIESASKLDQGRYQCSAKNLAITKDSRPVRLRVHGKSKIEF